MNKRQVNKIPAHLVLLWVCSILFVACVADKNRPQASTENSTAPVLTAIPGGLKSAPAASPTLIRIPTRPGGPTPTRVPTWMLGPYPPPAASPIRLEITAYPAQGSVTPTPPSTPTIFPHPTRTFESPLITYEQPFCDPQGKYTRCRDDLLGISFEYPTRWGEIKSELRRGDTSFAYEYTFSESGWTRGGGRSLDFTEGRGGILTDVYGFRGMNSWEYCFRYSDIRNIACPVVHDRVVLDIHFTNAQGLCEGGPLTISEPYAKITIDLPENKIVQGFGFVAKFISDELDSELRTILGGYADGDLAKNCDSASQAAYENRIIELSEQIQADRLDPETQDNLKLLIHLARSVQFK